MEKLECLGGCGDAPIIFFFLNVHRLAGGAGIKSRTFGVCDVCSTPGSPRYRPAQRKQKSSGSLALCADCLAKICDGQPLPQKLRDGIAAACLAMDIKLQRALPLSAKPAKRNRGKR